MNDDKPTAAERRVRAMKLAGLLQADSDEALARYLKLHLGKDGDVAHLRLVRELLELLAASLEHSDEEHSARLEAARDALSPPSETDRATDGEMEREMADEEEPTTEPGGEPLVAASPPRLDAPAPHEPAPGTFTPPRGKPASRSPWAAAETPRTAPMAPRWDLDEESTRVLMKDAPGDPAQQRVDPDGFTADGSTPAAGPALPFSPAPCSDSGSPEASHPDGETAPGESPAPQPVLPFTPAAAGGAGGMRVDPDGETIFGTSPSDEPVLPFERKPPGGEPPKRQS
jgi:hypothetical protein